MKLETKPKHTSVLNSAVIVGALGYFVDIYDLVLFSIVRMSSLKAIGVPPEELLDTGVLLINTQMTGMLVGGILWGILGDKRGRLSVLFGSIFLYSIANILNAFVTSVEAYQVLRFFAGIGLAGELGAAITLVSEVMTKETRGYGTSLVAGIGICGAVAAALVGDYFDWKTAYLVGGGLGLLLLILRIGIYESGMFQAVKSATHIKRGDIFYLFNKSSRFYTYMNCILIGIPIWYTIGILITFSPELSQSLGATGTISAGKAIMFAYIGLAIGDIMSGLLSQYLKSRKKAVFVFLTLTLLFVILYFNLNNPEPGVFYLVCALLGFGNGYWALFVTIAAEQFGTNIRSTVATTVPNFVRGSVVPLTLGFQSLKNPLGLKAGALSLGIFVLLIAYLALWRLKESFGKDLDFLEHHESI